MTESWIWGVDLGTRRLAFGFAPLDGGPIVCATLDIASDRHGDTLGARLLWAAHRTEDFAHEFTLLYAPVAVWVEQPTGRFPNPNLSYVAGVVQVVLAGQTDNAPVWLIAPSAWKKKSVGVGSASKETVAEWVTAQGGEVASQHEADAYAIAAAGRAMFLAGEWDAAVA